MDLSSWHGQVSPIRQIRAQPSSGSLGQQRPDAIRSQTHPRSSPLPQAQWSDIPLPYRPRDWVDPHDSVQPQISHEWRLRPSIPGNALSSNSPSSPPKPRRRPHGLRRLARRNETTEQPQPFDQSLLYPQMSPYDDRFSSYSAPDEMQTLPRSVSQPTTPANFRISFDDPEPHTMQLPRSPTYPPAGRRRMHSDTGVQDAAFADVEEFRLFVEATAGLGPEQAFRNSSSASLNRQRDRTAVPATPDQAVSPIEETPTTMRALQHLAQMPEGSSQRPRQRLQTSTSGLDLWLQPPSATSLSPENDELQDLEADEDEELPDYASSQAQAQAAQRVEAARRAQELQRRWQETGARRIF